MKNAIIFIVIVSFLFSCGKDDQAISGNKVVTGTAFYKNRFSQDSTKLIPYASGEVYVRNINDPKDSYFMKVITDTDGKFYLVLKSLPAVVYIKPTASADANSTILLYE